MDELENGLLRELRVVLELEFGGFAFAELLRDMFDANDSESESGCGTEPREALPQ